MQEFEGCFSFDMEAENMADAALLVRFRTNARNKINSMHTIASEAGKFESGLVIAKHHRSTGEVQKRK